MADPPAGPAGCASARCRSIVQQILGHTDIKSTERYAHIGEQTHVDAVSAITDTFAADTPLPQPELKKAAND